LPRSAPSSTPVKPAPSATAGALSRRPSHPASYPARPALDMTERQLGMLALHKLSPGAEGDNPAE
jgi:hypothetical protein